MKATSIRPTSLQAHVAADLEKLMMRLAKQGVPNVGQMDYESYLRSTFWQTIRAWVLKRDNYTCAVCRFKRRHRPQDCFDVHHRDYELATMEGRASDQLVTLCRSCHEKVEHYPDGARRYLLGEKDVELNRLQALHLHLTRSGMPLKITATKGSISVEYVGPDEYLLFYSLRYFMFGFALSIERTHRDDLRLPRPTGQERLTAPNGIPILAKATGKPIARITCDEKAALIKLTRACEFPFDSYLRTAIKKTKPWRTSTFGVASHARRPV